MSENHGAKPVIGISGGFGKAMDMPRTGDSDTDRVLAILRDEGYELRDMAMPFPLVIMSFNNRAAQSHAVLIYKDGAQPVTTPAGMVITESLIAIGPDRADDTEPNLIPVRKFLAERSSPRM